MALIVPHTRSSILRHAAIPWLWRARCSCGASFLAPNEAYACEALIRHIEAEEPFPDWTDFTPDEETPQ